LREAAREGIIKDNKTLRPYRDLEKWVKENLIDLYKRNRVRIIGDRKIIPKIEDMIKSEKTR